MTDERGGILVIFSPCILFFDSSGVAKPVSETIPF